jgi:hypothetical protein
VPLNADVRRYIKALNDYHLEERQQMVRFAPMICQCRPWFDWQYDGPPQADCTIHTTIMFDRDGDWL